MFRMLSARLARRRRARELHRRMRELDRLDRRHGLGAPLPTPPGSPLAARPRRSAGRGHTRTSLALTVLLTALVVTFNPTSTGERVRQMIGLGRDVTFTITDPGVAGYSFSMTQPDGQGPVTWDGCREIGYQVNPEDAPADYQQLLAAATDDLEQASGLRFRYDGTTTDRTFEGRAGRFGAPPPVLVAWASPEEVSALAGDVAGVGGAEARSVAPDRLAYVTGMVALDRGAFDTMDPSLQQAVVVHELAHVLGLGHTEDPSQLMYAETTGQTRLGAGDRDGLAILGSGPCG